MTDLIAIGRITKSVGIKGEVRVFPLTDNPKRFDMLETVWIGSDDRVTEAKNIASVRYDKNLVYLFFDDVTDRNSSEALREKFIFVPKELVIKPQGGKNYVHDIIGLDAVDENGSEIGKVIDVRSYPAQDLWVVKRGSKEILIPAVEEFILRVDLRKKQAIIRTMEGLIDPD